MSLTRLDFLTRIRQLVRDDASILQDAELRAHLADAVSKYEDYRPRVSVSLVAGDGSTYNYDLPTGWIDEFSVMLAIEYPVQDAGRPEFLSQKLYEMLETENGQKIRLYDPFGSGYNARFVYSIPHTLDDSTCTISQADLNPVCHKAAALCCASLASYYNQTARATISADVVDYFDKARIYQERGKDFSKMFSDAIVISGYAIGDWDMEPSWGDKYGEYLFKGWER